MSKNSTVFAPTCPNSYPLPAFEKVVGNDRMMDFFLENSEEAFSAYRHLVLWAFDFRIILIAKLALDHFDLVLFVIKFGKWRLTCYFLSLRQWHLVSGWNSATNFWKSKHSVSQKTWKRKSKVSQVYKLLAIVEIQTEAETLAYNIIDPKGKKLQTVKGEKNFRFHFAAFNSGNH